MIIKTAYSKINGAILYTLKGEEGFLLTEETSDVSFLDGEIDGSLYYVENGKLVPIPPPDPEDVLAKKKAEIELIRKTTFEREADPLFFKWQAGEGTEEEWKAKRQEIRDRFPYP
jgi:hypothetical protein